MRGALAPSRRSAVYAGWPPGGVALGNIRSRALRRPDLRDGAPQAVDDGVDGDAEHALAPPEHVDHLVVGVAGEDPSPAADEGHAPQGRAPCPPLVERLPPPRVAYSPVARRLV